MNAFHASVEEMSPEETTDDDVVMKARKKNVKYVVEGGMMFNNLVAMCLKYFVKIIENHLEYNKGKSKSKSKK